MTTVKFGMTEARSGYVDATVYIDTGRGVYVNLEWLEHTGEIPDRLVAYGKRLQKDMKKLMGGIVVGFGNGLESLMVQGKLETGRYKLGKVNPSEPWVSPDGSDGLMVSVEGSMDYDGPHIDDEDDQETVEEEIVRVMPSLDFSWTIEWDSWPRK